MLVDWWEYAWALDYRMIRLNILATYGVINWDAQHD